MFRGELIITPATKDRCSAIAGMQGLRVSIEGKHDSGLRCGYRECWTASLGWSDTDFQDATVREIWDFKKKQERSIGQNKDVTGRACRHYSNPKPNGKSRPFAAPTAAGCRSGVRLIATPTPFNRPRGACGRDGEMDVSAALYRFRDSYAGDSIQKRAAARMNASAFQFSHHTVDAEGNVTHAGQFLETTPGVFPNYDFVREIKTTVANR